MLFATGLAAALSAEIWATEPAAGDAGLDFFERRVRPILAARCYECHSSEAKTLAGSLRLDSRSGMLRGGDSGPAIIPKQPEESLLIEAINYRGELVQMPPGGKLLEAEIGVLTEWVRRGAIAPDDAAVEEIPDEIDYEAGRQFWSFQPVKQHPLPHVKDAAWPRKRIDFFLLSRLEQEGLPPSPPADRRTLLRRATFDLVGFPSSVEEVDAFVADPSPDAFEKRVAMLLASPHYGERWGRYWLDLVRYCDVPEKWAITNAQAWLYRDWVVRAINDDLPYDEFVRRQLAADLMPDCDPGQLAALGLLGLSPNYWKELKLAPDVIETVVAEEWEERIHTLGSGLLGLTIACARCHDHKYDPISTEDYYGLAGVLASTKLADRSLLPPEEAKVVEAARSNVRELEHEIKKLSAKKPLKDEDKKRVDELRHEAAAIRESTPHFESSICYGVIEASLRVLPDGPDRTKLHYVASEPQNLRVQIRGNPANLGAEVPRRFLTVLSPNEPRPFAQGSGRRELAEAITRDAAGLTARVIVNRVWKHHFGRGLVETPSNFGRQGSPPTHPELLDDLAARFIEQGWSLKWLHGEIMLSAAYQQQSRTRGTGHTKDPDNRWLCRMNRRRLDVEAWRDAMLAATDRLDRTIGGPPGDLADVDFCRRTLYGSVVRRELNDMLRLYDFPDPTTHSPSRELTTTPLQQLFVLNSPLVERQAETLAEATSNAADEPARIQALYRRLFQRVANEVELAVGGEFLAAGRKLDQSEAEIWRQYAHALLGSNEFMFID